MKVLIADDEPLARQRLRGLLAGMAVDVVGEAGDGEAVLAACTRQRVDVVLLDIAMPGTDGLDAARRLRTLDAPPAVVFCTAFDAHALSAFEAAAVDYLVKPVRAERLAAALDRARAYLRGHGQAAPSGPAARQRTHLCARLGGSLRLIPLEAVYYLQAEEKYVVVHHAQGEDLIEEPLKALEREFGERLLRIHRNCLVARAQITGLQRGHDGHVHATLRHVSQPLEVSRRCVAQVREALQGL